LQFIVSAYFISDFVNLTLRYQVHTTYRKSRALAQEFSGARVQSWASPCWICGGQGGTRTDFYQLLRNSLSLSLRQCSVHILSCFRHCTVLTIYRVVI